MALTGNARSGSQGLAPNLSVEAYKKQAADFICEKYNWDEVVKETMKLYRNRER